MYDLFLLLCSIVFLGFLFIQLASTLKKLHHSLPLFRLLYVMVTIIIELFVQTLKFHTPFTSSFFPLC